MKPRDDILRDMLAAGPKAGWSASGIVFLALILAGVSTFLVEVTGPRPERAWLAYLVNFIFWTGLTSGAMLLSAILTMTNARWGRPIKRLAEALGAFLPVSFLLFWVLYFGREKLFPWVLEPVPHKEWWLNVGFMFLRDGVGLLLLAGLAAAIVYSSVRADLDTIAEGQEETAKRDSVRRGRGQSISAPVFAIAYAFILSLLAIDLVMSLSPHWVSTLFPAYYFIGSFYTGLAAMIFLSATAVKTMGMGEYIGTNVFHDLGKLLFGFCVVTGDFFYAQFLVIWYGNLPEETRFILVRLRESPWDVLSWTVLGVCFVFPFIALLSRKIKMKPAAMALMSIVVLIGMWFERFLLAAPSFEKSGPLLPGIPEALISAGFLGLVAFCALSFLKAFPALPVSDPLFVESVEKAERVGHGRHAISDTE